MAKEKKRELKGVIPEDLWNNIQAFTEPGQAEKNKKKKRKKRWSEIATELLDEAADDPGDNLPVFPPGIEFRAVHLNPSKHAWKAAQVYMGAHGIKRRDMLGFALARGWELYNK